MKAFLLWVIKNVRFAALIIAGIILGTCFIKMWHYGDVFSTEYLIVYINSNAAYELMYTIRYSGRAYMPAHDNLCHQEILPSRVRFR